MNLQKRKQQPCSTNWWKALAFDAKEGQKKARRGEERKEQKNKGSPEVIKKLGDATLLFAEEKFNKV